MLVAGRRGKLAALAAAATMVLAGCGTHPGAAAVVGPETITHDEVDTVALALCAANTASARANNQPLPALPTRGAREVALEVLVETALSQQFGEQAGVEVDPQLVSREMSLSESGFAMVPEDRRDDLRTALREYTEAQLILAEAGRREVGSGASLQEAIAAGTEQRQEYVDRVDVEVDPRYGRFADGGFSRGGTSLSVAVSDRAVAGDRQQPDSSFVSGLPASQQCR